MEEQCKGITKSGKRCKIKQGLVNGYCKFHSDQDPGSRDNTIDEAPKDDYQKDENIVADVAYDVNKGLSTIVLIFIAIISFIIFMFFKRRKK